MSKREQDKEARRRAILDAAKKIFAAKGFHNTSVSDIVQEVGIAQGTFYLYFDDKKAIFSEIVDSLTERLFKLITIQDIKEVKSISDIEAGVDRISTPLISFFQENRDLGKIFLREAVGTGLGFDEKINQFYDRVTDVGVHYTEHFRKQGIIGGDYDARIAMTFLIGGAQMIIYRWVTDGLDVSEEDIVNSVKELCLKMFR
ncbi:MAG: TetR/AcrR family transcriptional regulator [Chrysiogenetes bacterium]|nr:TetR/AcrR family transcriptional regulator [Chrysiogenetes bacterium]